MSIVYNAILILILLDTGVILLAFRMDKILYPASMYDRGKFKKSSFFINRHYDEPASRFMLSKGGILLLWLILIIVILLSHK